MSIVSFGRMPRASSLLAAAIILALVGWFFASPFMARDARAASLTNYKDTLSDSDLGVGSNHTIEFTTLNGVSAGESITIDLDDNFGGFANVGDPLDFNDIDFYDSGGSKTLGSTASGATWGVSTSTGNVITITSGTDTVASSSAVAIYIGTNATTTATGDTQITNPASPGSYKITTTVAQDSGELRVAIIDDVVVTATVDTSFTFTVAGVANGETINGDAGTTTAVTTTATTLPYGTLLSGVEHLLAQELTVSTNAVNGFSVTVFQDQNLQSESGADIDLFADADATSTPRSWLSPSGVLDQENTYGHIGLTSEDSDLNGDEFGSAFYAGNFASTTPREIFSHTGPADGTTPDKGLTRVGYKIEITDLQEAATLYTNTLTYIATPTF